MNAVNVHKDNLEILRDYSDSELGLLFRALMADVLEEEETELPPDLSTIRKYIRNQNARFSKQQSEKRQRKPSEPTRPTQPTQPNEPNEPTQPTVSISVPVPVSVTEPTEEEQPACARDPEPVTSEPPTLYDKKRENALRVVERYCGQVPPTYAQELFDAVDAGMEPEAVELAAETTVAHAATGGRLAYLRKVIRSWLDAGILTQEQAVRQRQEWDETTTRGVKGGDGRGNHRGGAATDGSAGVAGSSEKDQSVYGAIL